MKAQPKVTPLELVGITVLAVIVTWGITWLVSSFGI